METFNNEITVNGIPGPGTGLEINNRLIDSTSPGNRVLSNTTITAEASHVQIAIIVIVQEGHAAMVPGEPEADGDDNGI